MHASPCHMRQACVHCPRPFASRLHATGTGNGARGARGVQFSGTGNMHLAQLSTRCMLPSATVNALRATAFLTTPNLRHGHDTALATQDLGDAHDIDGRDTMTLEQHPACAVGVKEGRHLGKRTLGPRWDRSHNQLVQRRPAVFPIEKRV